MTIRFEATLPLKVSTKRKVVSEKRYNNLSEEERVYRINGGRLKGKTYHRATYYRLVPVEPYDNPLIIKLRRLLLNHNIRFNERKVNIGDKEFIHFTTGVLV